MLRLWKKSPSPEGDHEELFMERYDQLRRWSLHLADNDVDLAEDLLHDAFIHWTFTRPDLASIQNLEGYLYEILRNLRISQLRRASRNRLQQLSIFEYDQAEAGLRTIDPRGRMQVQYELQHVCQYACARKDTSTGGSILILRFFHGYYPSEIASILRSTRGSVDQRLRLIRGEIRISLANPERLSFLRGSSSGKEIVHSASAPTAEQLLAELRRAIFASCSAECLSSQQLKTLYQSKEKTTLDCSTVAHIVSCVSCLDEVSSTLGMPTLAERHVFDSLGLDRSSKGGPPAGGSGGGATMEPVRPLRRRAKDVFEHRPQELHISVNGFVLGSQKVNAELSELTLDVNLTERLSFVEVFSEQETRLLFFKVEEPPPTGPVHQAVKIDLSDNRTLELALQFRTPCPVVHAIYRDPLVQFEGAIEDMHDQLLPAAAATAEQTTGFSAGPYWRRQLLLQVRRLIDPTLWLRPAAVTAIVAMLLVVGAMLMFRSPASAPPHANDLLRQAADIEDAVALKPDRVVHRSINLEERSLQGNLITRRRLDVWRNGSRKLDAVRVYDEQNRLVRGEWKREGVGRVLLHHGSKLQPSPAQKINAASLTFDRVWQILPSAESFIGLVEKTETAKVTETPIDYTIAYERDTSGVDGLQRAVVVLSRPELRATKQVLLVKQGNEVREYTFIESGFEVRPAETVAPAVFEPEPEVLGSDTGTRRSGETGSVPESPHLPVTASPIAATADLEVEVLRLLDQAGADQGEQVSANRGQDGLLRISGVVETAARKSEIARALNPILNNPAVRFEVQTVAEVIARQRSEKNKALAPVTIEGVEIQAETFPAYQELRARLSDAEARAFASRMIDRSHAAMRYAGALKRLVNQFSQQDLKSLSPEARGKWLTLIRGHAKAFEQETRSLRQELQPTFFPSALPGGTSGVSAIDEGSLANGVQRLFDLGVTNERMVSSAFATSSSGARTTVIRSEHFWQSLVAAEAVAASLQKIR